MPGPGAARLPTGLLAVNSIRLSAVQFLNASPAKVERLCLPGAIEEYTTIELPATVKPISIPKDVDASNALATYRARYARDGNSIKVSRKLEMNFPSTVCSPDSLILYREILEQVRRDTSAQMTYE